MARRSNEFIVLDTQRAYTCYVHSDELIWKFLTFYTHLNIRNMGMGWKQQESLNLHECWFQFRRVGWAGDKFLEQKDILGHEQQLVVRQYLRRDWSSFRLAILHISRRPIHWPRCSVFSYASNTGWFFLTGPAPKSSKCRIT